MTFHSTRHRFAARLAGTCNEVMRAEPTCDNSKYLHTFQLAPEGLILTKRYLVPVEGGDGLVAEERYRVLYGEENSVVLFREGETFEHRDTGDKIVRQLILESEDAFATGINGRSPLRS